MSLVSTMELDSSFLYWVATSLKASGRLFFLSEDRNGSYLLYPVDWSSPTVAYWFSENKDRSIDLSKVAKSQEGLTIVMDRVGPNLI